MQLQVPTLQWEALKPPRILGSRGKDSTTLFTWRDASQWHLPQHRFFLTQLWNCTRCSLAIANHFPSILIHCPHICYIGPLLGRRSISSSKETKERKEHPSFRLKGKRQMCWFHNHWLCLTIKEAKKLSAPMAATPVAASNYCCKKKQKCVTGLWLSKRQKQAINCHVVLVVESRQTSLYSCLHNCYFG